MDEFQVGGISRGALQWPTLFTLVVLLILVLVYARLANAEERNAVVELGSEYARYQEQASAFIPRCHQPGQGS